MEPIIGQEHSIETFGTVDGPGIRYIVFLKGCPFRCLYCHNPDTWRNAGATAMSVNEIVEDFLRYKKFYDNGGVTISGGEPLMQSRFVEELLESFRALKVHTVIDTAGSVPITESKKCLELASLVLLDIKAPNEEMYRRITSQSMKDTLDTLDYCEKIGKSVWIRHVVVPGLTDSDESINGICDIVAGRKCVERVELLPFHKLGEFKWRELGLDYKLYDTPAPTNLRMAELRAIIDKRCKRL